MPLVDVCYSEPWQLCVGGLQVQCSPRSQDGVDRLAVSRGLLTCCRRGILVSQVDTTGVCHRLLMLTDISSSFVLMEFSANLENVVSDSKFSLLLQTCLLLGGLFPLVSALCEEKLDCHYYVFEGIVKPNQCLCVFL